MLETKNVFIDTQYFVKSGLHFDGPAFKKFIIYCKKGELSSISTSVVVQEVESKIKDSVAEALNAVKTFRRKARLLSSLDDTQIKGLFNNIAEDDIYRKSGNVFKNFMNECSTETVDAKHLNGEDLLELYFSEKPPFGDGKKKSEFPDAISLLSLKSHLKRNEKIYVVSEDADLKQYCDSNDQFISVESLDKLLDIYTNHTSERHEQVIEYFDKNELLIKRKISEYLEGCDVYNNSTWDDSEVEGKIKVTDMGDIEPSVIFISDEESEVTFDIDIEFNVTVIGPDFINGTYDREDDRVFTHGSTSRFETIETDYIIEVFLNYHFSNGHLENVEVKDLNIEEASIGIEVAVEEYEAEEHL